MKEEIINKIIGILKNSIQGLEVTPEMYDSDLVELGMESMIFVAIVVALEDEFHCEIPDLNLLIPEMNTVHKIYDVVASLLMEPVR